MKTTDFTQAFINANNAVIDNKPALVMTHALRQLIKACEEKITELSDEALDQALKTLDAEGKRQGEFTYEGLRFQLQVNETYDFSNYSRYKGADAIRWREKKEQQDQAKKYSAALTREMKGIVDGFVATHPDWQPDEIKCILKCIAE